MLGLPSTTEVMRPMPKTAFYENLALPTAEKKCFVSQITRLTLANSVKVSTLNIVEGDKHQEILVLLIDLKIKEISRTLLETIAKQNSRPLVIVCRYLNEECVFAYRQKLYDTGWRLINSIVFDIAAENLDELWDSICSQIVFGEAWVLDAASLDTRLSLSQDITELETELVRMKERSLKEKQPAKKNQLHGEAMKKKQELEQLKAGR